MKLQYFSHFIYLSDSFRRHKSAGEKNAERSQNETKVTEYTYEYVIGDGHGIDFPPAKKHEIAYEIKAKNYAFRFVPFCFFFLENCFAFFVKGKILLANANEKQKGKSHIKYRNLSLHRMNCQTKRKQFCNIEFFIKVDIQRKIFDKTEQINS